MSNYQPVAAEFNQDGTLVKIWGPNSQVAFDPSSVAITGGVIGAGVRLAGVNLSLDDYGTSNPLYIAHRGSAALYPEESKLAYDISLMSDGLVALETDVQTLSDGSLGLMHDSTVDRTTTGTGNVNTFTSTTFQALTMDSSVWLGSNYGDTLNPMMYQAYIDAYKGKAILLPEDKDFLSMTAMVRALINSGVPRNQALVQCAQASNLATAVSAGYQAIGLTSAGSMTPAAIVATGARWVGYDYTNTLASDFTAVGLKAIAYTVNRRYLRDQQSALGAMGFFSDDPIYLRSSAALSTTDFFSRQTWVPGMLSNDSVGTVLATRGSFTAPNWWGYASASAVPGYCGCLQGYLCPVAIPSNFTFTFNAIFDAANGGDVTKWLSVFIGTSDVPYTDTADATSGYHLLFRLDGRLQIFRKDVGIASTLLQTASPGALSTGVEYTFRVSVTPGSVKLDRLVAGSSVSSVTAADPTYRGGYLQLGRGGMACRFRSLQVA